MADRPRKHPDLLVRRHDAARRRCAVRRGCRGAEVVDRAPALPRRARTLPRGGGERRAAHRRLHPGSAAVLRGRRRRAARDIASPISARPPAGRRMPTRPARRWRRCSPPPPSRCPRSPFVSLDQRGRHPDLRPRRAARSRPATLLKDHLDVTVLITPPADVTPPRVTDFPVVKGTIRSAKGHLGAFELTVDDYAAAGAVVARRARLRRGAQRRGVALRPRARPLRRRAAVPGADLRDGYLRADPGDPAAVLARGAEGARSRRHVRQAALRHVHRGPLRAFALEASSAARAASISARPARSRPPAIMSRSTRISAPAAANAPPSARPAPPPMRCRRPTR